MGQIKNIKLHIVTDIKVPSMDHAHKLSDALPTTQPKETLHIEVTQLHNSIARPTEIETQVSNFLQEVELSAGATYTEFPASFVFLTANVACVRVCENDDYDDNNGGVLDMSKYTVMLYVYQLTTEGAASEEIDEEEEISAANHWILPAREFHGMWENLIFDTDVKQQLLNYAQTTLLFSDKGVDTNVISWNRVVLLHGPPGTGKTSLCKALAQKLSIRLSKRYTSTQLVEINSHSLFSKWFSESGKLVQKMFTEIKRLMEDTKSLVCVLIDEVESLTAARKAAVNGNEPSDAIRVVNALLTQIDAIKRHPNVFILTTSNLSGSIDLAFVDRADIKQYIGPPTRRAISSIYESSVRELIVKGAIDTSESEVPVDSSTFASDLRAALERVSEDSQGFSGRTLRKLPFIAFALFIRSSVKPNLAQFIDALSNAVQRQKDERGHIPT